MRARGAKGLIISLHHHTISFLTNGLSKVYSQLRIHVAYARLCETYTEVI
jgi:hypothetical protein